MTVTAVQGDWSDFHRRALERVVASARRASAAFAWGAPLTGNSGPALVEIEGHPVREAERPVRAAAARRDTGYFALLGLPIAEGRDFRATDDRDARAVAVVNQAFADRYFLAIARDRQEDSGCGGRTSPPIGHHRRRRATAAPAI